MRENFILAIMILECIIPLLLWSPEFVASYHAYISGSIFGISRWISTTPGNGKMTFYANVIILLITIIGIIKLDIWTFTLLTVYLARVILYTAGLIKLI